MTIGDEEINEYVANFTPVRRVMKEGEVASFQDLGLGRGVDATNPTPWLNKRPLQIREVYYNDIIGTEEGNLYQGFVNEVESTQHFQTNLSASVPLNQLVNLGIDSELSRSYSVSQKSVGRKITTRTISFRAPFDRICKSDANEKQESKKQGSITSMQSLTETRRAPSFEDRLKGWIKQQWIEENEKKKLQNQEGENGGDKQGDKIVWISIDALNSDEKRDLCSKFVSTFSVTHYVHSLELGASHYRVMSLEEYSMKFSNKTKLGVGQMADIAIGQDKSSNRRKYKSQTTKVGRMNMKLIDDDSDDSRLWAINFRRKNKKNDEQEGDQEESKPTEKEQEVARGTIGEAVVGVKLQPISSLVFGNVGLRIALQQALQLYIHNKQKIKCKQLLYL